MKTRNTSYTDYGFQESEKESKRLKKYCCQPEFDEHVTLMQAAVSANASIAGDLFYSLRENLSYDEIERIKYIPISRGDFYGYQRKCLFIFRDLLRMYRKWE